MKDFIRRRRLKSVKLGLAAGLCLGGYMTMVSLTHALVPTFGTKLVEMWQELYPFYRPTFLGSWIIFGWGFLDGFFMLWLVGSLYNWLTQSGYGCRSFPRKSLHQKDKRGSIESEDA